LFQQSFPDIIICQYYVIMDFDMAIAILAKLKISDWLIDW